MNHYSTDRETLDLRIRHLERHNFIEMAVKGSVVDHFPDPEEMSALALQSLQVLGRQHALDLFLD